MLSGSQSSIKCTCLTELEEDGYSPGGPSSGLQRPPPCEYHKENSE